MKNQELAAALTAALQARQEKRGNSRGDANAYTVGYLTSLIGVLCEGSPKTKKNVMDTLVYVLKNQE